MSKGLRMTKSELQALLAKNPHIKLSSGPDRTEAKKGQAPLAAKSAESFSCRFEKLWRELGGPALEAEVRFHEKRRWRFDFAHTKSRVAIELDGGVFSKGRHTRGKGFQNDCEKLNAATALGWRVFRLPTGFLKAEHIQPIIDFINS